MANCVFSIGPFLVFVVLISISMASQNFSVVSLVTATSTSPDSEGQISIGYNSSTDSEGQISIGSNSSTDKGSTSTMKSYVIFTDRQYGICRRDSEQCVYDYTVKEVEMLREQLRVSTSSSTTEKENVTHSPNHPIQSTSVPVTSSSTDSTTLTETTSSRSEGGDTVLIIVIAIVALFALMIIGLIVCVKWRQYKENKEFQKIIDNQDPESLSESLTSTSRRTLTNSALASLELRDDQYVKSENESSRDTVESKTKHSSRDTNKRQSQSQSSREAKHQAQDEPKEDQLGDLQNRRITDKDSSSEI